MKTAMYLWRYSSTGGIYMALTHLTSATFDQAVNAGDDVVVVDFFATWCGPCKMLAPAVERMAELHPEAHFYKVDIDEEMDLASRFQVMSVPTLIYFKNGQEVNKTVGLISPAELEAALEKAK
jgi:thioredoxin